MPKSRDSSVQVAAIVAVLLAGVGGAWLFLNAGHDEAVEAGQVTATASSISSSAARVSDDAIPVDTALQMAEMAFQSGQLADSEDGSAMDFYRQVLAQEPDNARALTGMRLIETQLNDEANEFLAKGDYAQVANRLKLLNKVQAGSDKVLVLQEQLREKANAMFQEMDEAIAENRLARAEELAEILRNIPEADSGRISASLVTIATKRKELEAATLENSAAAVEPFNLPETQAQDGFSDPRVGDDITVQPVESGALSAESVSAPEELVPPVDTTATLIAELLTKANARVDENRLFSPESDSALYFLKEVLALDDANSDAKRGLRGLVQKSTSRAYSLASNQDFEGANTSLDQAASVGLASELVEQARRDINQQYVEAESQKVFALSNFEVEKTVPPKYPNRAIDRSIEGWVKIEFTVTENGDTSNLKVVESSERFAKQFSRAALTAVEQWRFKPRMIDGEAIAQRSQTTVQFRLQ